MKTLSEAISGVELAGGAYQKTATQTAGDVDAAAAQQVKLDAAAAAVAGDQITQTAAARDFNSALDALVESATAAHLVVDAPPPAA